MLEPISGYLCLAERHSVRELVEEALRHWSGTWIDQIDAKAPHEAPLLNLLFDKAPHRLGLGAALGFRHHRGVHRGLVPARGGRAGLSAGELPGRSGEPCGHAHPVMGACCCAA